MRYYFWVCSEHVIRMYKRLVFCGGGTRVLFFLPSLVLFEKEGLLSDVNEYWGTSAGALLATFMAITRSASATHGYLHELKYTQFRDINIDNLFAINRVWGLDNGDSMMKEIERVFELIQEGISKKTLRDYPGLNIIVGDLTAHEILILNSVTHPELRIVEAIRASMSLPILYIPYRHAPTGNHWIDGAVRANFPWSLLPTDEARKEALGFMFEKSSAEGLRTFNDYMFSMIHFDEPKKIERYKKDWPNNIVWFPKPPYPAWYMTLNADDFQLIESVGTRVASEWLASKGDSLCLPGKTETPGLCEDQNTHPPSLPRRCITELSGNRSPCPEPSQDSSRPQSHCTLPSYRRWSV